jgi:nitrite reductase/ring-hydroxylating ferredoxin subunit/DMSO/TMAO reductase YedYZ heme-binding membrane subunit
MSASYQSILWNRQKRIYDLILAAFVLLYLALFAVITLITHPETTQETVIIRSTSTLALLLLHIILCIGPLARLNTIFLPLLYNRRHLGVTMFCIGAIHGIFAIIQFHALGNINPVISVFVSNTQYDSLTKFPFEIFGAVALLIFFLMAITSHDFWLHNLTPKVWKVLHMCVYIAYASIILHVVLGVIQYETSPVLGVMLGLGFTTVSTLHIIAGHKESRKDHEALAADPMFVKVCSVHEIQEKRAKVVSLNGERIAIFKYDNKLSAISNVCKHQNGPLGEGKIVDGCITCPWHGYQYLPHNGSSPPPFKEKVATFDVKIINQEVWVNPAAYPEGTERPVAHLTETP